MAQRLSELKTLIIRGPVTVRSHAQAPNTFPALTRRFAAQRRFLN